MKKVLIFSLQYYPWAGGAEIAIKEITDRIATSDIEFHLVTLRFHADDEREERIGNVFVHRVGQGRRGLTYTRSFSPAAYVSKICFVPLAVLAARRLHRTHRFDGFWAMMSYMLFPVVLARWIGVRAPYLVTLQEGDPFGRVFNRPHILPFRPLLRAGFKHAYAVQAISTFLADWARRLGTTAPIEVIGNGVDIGRFAQPLDPPERAALRATLGATTGDTLLVTTSRLVKKNAVDDVIRALTRLPESVHFVICGAGPDAAMLRILAREQDIAGRVHFAGLVSHDELPRFLHACDMFIRPSRSEGMGNSFIEAMAVGLPIIATQEGGIADFLFDRKRNPDRASTGFAVDRNSPRQIATQVTYILSHPEEATHTVENAKRLVAERYSWDHIAPQMHALLLSVCA